MTPRSPRAGFTLIELLTVIAIVGILAAIIIPTVGKVRESARTSQCVSNMRQVVVSLNLYAADRKGQLPAAFVDGGQDGFSHLRDWSQVIEDYLPRRKDSTGSRHPVLTCPSNNYDERAPNGVIVSHTYSLGVGAMAVNQFNNNASSANRRLISSIRNPSQAVWLWEAGLANSTFKIPDSNVNRDELQEAIANPGPDGHVAFWHGGGNRTNVAFGDGSVRGHTAAELRAKYPPGNDGYRLAAGL